LSGYPDIWSGDLPTMSPTNDHPLPFSLHCGPWSLTQIIHTPSAYLCLTYYPDKEPTSFGLLLAEKADMLLLKKGNFNIGKLKLSSSSLFNIYS